MKYNYIRISGEKIDLCAFRSDEEAIEKYMKWMNNEDVAWRIGRGDLVTDINSERNWVNKPIDGLFQHKFNIVTKTGELIGNCDINFKKYRQACLGICIGESEYTSIGIGTEVIKLLIKFSFEELNAHRVYLNLIAENERAHRCYLKTGLRDCGYAHDIAFHKGKWLSSIQMEILENDYFNTNK